MRFRHFIFAAFISFCFIQSSFAAFILDFEAATKTYIGGWQSTPPGVADFPAIPGLGATMFEVGNLTNGCGLYPGRAARQETGTMCGFTGLAEEIHYDSGSDTFVLGDDTEAVLQLFVKLGHPEEADDGSSRLTQNQVETFDMFLNNGIGGSLELAQLLDDVDSLDRDIQNGYYLYTYEPGIISAGTWFPTFESRSGSIEFLARFSKVTRDAPEPASIFLLGSGLFVLGGVARRRRRRTTSSTS